MKKQGESCSLLMICVNSCNQGFGAADFAEERLLQVMLRRDTNVGQPLVVGQSGN